MTLTICVERTFVPLLCKEASDREVLGHVKTLFLVAVLAFLPIASTRLVSELRVCQ